jgi:hypothetical protein
MSAQPMMTQQEPTVINGVNVTALMATIGAVKANPGLGSFQFRARNKWLDGGHNRSTIQEFYGAGKEDDTRTRPSPFCGMCGKSHIGPRRAVPGVSRSQLDPLREGTAMFRLATVLAALLAVGVSTGASAEALKPLQAGTFTLDAWTASVYYTDSGGYYEVVTTFASPHQDDGVPIRFTAALTPGQTTTVAVGGFQPEAVPAVLEIKRTGDALSAEVIRPKPKV